MSSQAPRPTRILFIATDLSTGGGVNKVVRDLAVHFRDRLHAEVTVVNARSERPSSYSFPDEIAVIPGRGGGLVGYFRRLVGLRSLRADFVFGPWTQDNLLITLAFMFSRTRAILVEHASWNFHGPVLRLMRRMIYPLAWRVVTLNPADKLYYDRWLHNVALIPDPVAPVAAVGKVQREKLVLAVGHLTRLKNFTHAIRAFAASGLEDEGWSLAIVGDGPEKENLEQLVSELGLSRAAIHSSPTELASWYARATLALVTSHTEVFSLVLAEAMLSGVVPIAYASDGPRFILGEFQGHLVEMGDCESLALRLAHFARGPDLEPLRVRMAESILERFAPDRIAQAWNELLSSSR